MHTKTLSPTLMIPLALFILISTTAIAPPRVTPEKFLEEGAGVLIGQIVDVQVLEHEGKIEEGNVEIKIIEVLSGEVDDPVLNFPFRRRQTMIDSFGWDLISP